MMPEEDLLQELNDLNDLKGKLQALSKKIPKEPTKITVRGDVVGFSCPHCGQAIDWSGESIAASYGWIPEGEAYPPDDEIVLVQVSGAPCKSIRLVDAIVMATYSEDEGWISEEWPMWKECHPDAWMPLPKTYKRNEREKKDVCKTD